MAYKSAARCVGFAATLLVSGCSFVTVNGPTASDPRCLRAAATTSRAAPIADVVLGAAGVAFAAVVANQDLRGEAPGTGLATVFISVPSLLVGATYLGSAYYGFREVGRCRAAAEPMTDPAAQAWRTRAEALTRAAAAAARSGDCGSVVWQSAKVKQFDPELHATVFMKDVAIRRCLEMPATPADAQRAAPTNEANGDAR